MTADEEEIEHRVRAVVWPWDAPAVPDQSRRVRWMRVAIQLTVLALLAGLFFWMGHVFVTRVIAGLAGGFLLLAACAPAVYDRIERFFQRFGIGVGRVLTHVLLFPFYMICFVPGRMLLLLRNKDPMTRAFPAPTDSCWRPHKPGTFTHPYRRQY